MPRSIDQIRSDPVPSATLRNLVRALDAKLDLVMQYGMWEYEAAEDGLDAVSEGFRLLGAAERKQVEELFDFLIEVRGLEKEGLGPGLRAGRFRARSGERPP